ncbi:hypothetical protein MHYP_G00239170 [Metynnis hypsauchen]
MARLQSRFLNSSEDLCLQFWYYKPHQDSSELRVVLRVDVLQTEIWSSLAAESHAWRQVLIPLNSSQLNGAQIVFGLMQGHGNKEEIIFDKIGIWRGQCGVQCQSGTQLWTDESTQCTCTEGQLTCTQITCGDGQTCRQAVTSTVSSGTCRVASDLRYRTFDGVNFRFMGPCTYIFTKVCDGVSVVPGFSVEVQKEQRRNSSVSMIQQVKVNLQGLRVTLLRRDRRRIMVNGIWKNLPLSLYGDTVKVSAQGPVVELQTHFNLSVSYAKSGTLHVTVPNHFSDKLCGMCGNFNHVMDDDHKIVDGSLAENAQVLGQSWKSEDPPCEEPTKPSMCSEAEKLEYASEAYCGVLLSPHGPFSECSSALGAVSFFRSCVFEMCSTQGDPETFCDILQAFAKTCNDAGIPGTGWRNATYCRTSFKTFYTIIIHNQFPTALACRAHSHFNACSSECTATCSMLDATENCETCKERCECDDGFLLSGEKCVPADDCGCWVDGQHYGKGETFMQGDCKKQCLCAGQGTIQCSDASCVAHEVCKVKDEVLGCFPSSPVTCSIYGDPHYITFDGKAYSFRGTCNYTIAKTCTASAASFTLTARNEGRSNSSSLNSVALDVDGLHLVIRKNRLVYVNGGQVTLPYSHSTSVKVLQKGPYVQVDTNFGLRFLFNGNDRLFVQLDERHKGTMCGLCGTYSGSQFDDFLTPDGNVVPYSHDFASSWNTHDKDWTCSDGSAEDPECPPELDSEGFRECSKLLGEAFKACHWFVPPQIFVNSCVSDHCTSGGDLSQLCISLQNYVAACEVAEVFLANWWKDTVCGCPWSCNFDQSDCGWEQLIQDSFDWTRWSGPTPTDFTGPTSDHTTASGYYVYIEADGVHYGDSARMMSPVCNTLGTQCLTFWYHMYGWATAMALNVYKLDGNQATKIWSRLNNQGNSWQLAQIEVDSWGPFQIIMEGIRGSDVGSDVAWDDITITYGKCGHLSVSLNPETSSPIHGDQAFITPGGHYIYIEGDSATHGDTARLLSEECTDQQPQCLQFWYHMYGSSWTMGLSVYLLQGNQAREVWRKREDQGNIWHRALVDLIPEGNFKIIFEGRRGDNAWSDVAVDDISLHRGTCEVPSCPINSHYTNCMPTCQPTCEQLHGPPNCITDNSCVQGCVCNDGFVLRQSVCVPIWECGCQDDNGNNHYFGETWYSPHCTQKCECKRKGSQGELKCKDKECDGNEVCLMSEQGEYSCKSADFSKCSIDDDPEYKTFDNFKHKFKGKYSYVLVQTSNLPNNVPEVYIEGINQKSREQENRDEDYDDEDLDVRERGDDGDRSEEEDDSSEEDDDDGRLRALRIRVYNHTVEFREGRKVMVNGVLARAPVFPTPGLKILEHSSRLYLQTDYGLLAEFKGKGEAEISLPDTYKTKVGGLCGNYDGKKNNDLMKPNGQQANVNEFGESWRVVAEKAAVRQRRSSLLYALLGLRQ